MEASGLRDLEPSFNLGDLRAWPLDATIVYESNDMVSVLGSLKSAANLAEVAHSCGVQVDTLVTLCAKDLQAKGTPKSWDVYLRLCNAQQCVYALDDLMVKVTKDRRCKRSRPKGTVGYGQRSHAL